MTVGPRLLGKVALITGGASGIGAATATVFAEHGASVVVTDMNDNLGREVVNNILAKGGEATYLHLDTTDEDQWTEAIVETLSKYGALNILANNAGIADRRSDNKSTVKIEDTTVEGWDKVFAVNSTGVFLGVKHAIAPMRAAGGGSIINISS
ncbi:MAG: SDR family NAD(P)-dependent oxidoreductase, partial [Rhodospirillaceae bacterium]|nr:SDR family NAD(P)-dependent oxidoreductase [Rhodospirillaceae bacterium]